jgi:hypothetical protein
MLGSGTSVGLVNSPNTAVAVTDTNWTLAGTQPSATVAQIQAFYGLGAGTGGAARVSTNSQGGWNAGILLTAIEGVDDSGVMQYYFPVPDGSRSWFTYRGPLSSSGVSTGGKAAMYQSALAMPRGNARFGWVNNGDSGSSGIAIERFVNLAGLRLDVSVQEALRISGFSEADIASMNLPDNSAGLGPRLGHAVTLLGPTRTPGFYNVNPDGTLKMGTYTTITVPAYTGPVLDLTTTAPYGWQVDALPRGHIGPSLRSNAGSLGGFQDFWGVPRYLVGISAGDTMRGNPPGFPVYGTPAASNQVNARMFDARGWAPYFEDFQHAVAIAPATVFAPTTARLGTGASVSFFPYVAYQSINQSFSGIQNLIQTRNEQTTNGWHGANFRQFSDLHAGLNLDFARTQPPPQRGLEGMACVIPVDAYFGSMAWAPYGGQIIATPNEQARVNQPSQILHWILMDEAYKMYGEMEWYEEHGIMQEDPRFPGSGLHMGWDKYIWNNIFDFWWGGHAGIQTAALPSLQGFRARHLASGTGAGTSTADAMADIRIARFRDPVYDVTDPAYFFEYRKINWGRPRPDGSPGVTIAERVRRRVTMEHLRDYYLAEIYRQPSSQETTGIFANSTEYLRAAREARDSGALQLRSQRWRYMDWRGLTDNPEPMN